jgi:hypothetical protein
MNCVDFFPYSRIVVDFFKLLLNFQNFKWFSEILKSKGNF